MPVHQLRAAEPVKHLGVVGQRSRRGSRSVERRASLASQEQVVNQTQACSSVVGRSADRPIQPLLNLFGLGAAARSDQGQRQHGHTLRRSRTSSASKRWRAARGFCSARSSAASAPSAGT